MILPWDVDNWDGGDIYVPGLKPDAGTAAEPKLSGSATDTVLDIAEAK